MRELTKAITARVGRYEELEALERSLLVEAAGVRLRAQAPYSNYLVGVAVWSAKGTVHCGCNVERCTWTQTTHAEQNAIDSMVAEHGPSKLEVVALVAAPAGVQVLVPPTNWPGDDLPTKMEQIPVPCGHCLQIIWENCFGDPNVKLIAILPNGAVVSTTIGDALPMRFGPVDLGVDYGKK